MTNPVYQFIIISIHALREEGDSLGGDVILNQRNFNPRPPRGERPLGTVTTSIQTLFQSTPSARRATTTTAPTLTPSTHFNPRPPRGERLEAHNSQVSAKMISIHALREESDARRRFRCRLTGNFNPRPPRGERLDHDSGVELHGLISIHALREESDTA